MCASILYRNCRTSIVIRWPNHTTISLNFTSVRSPRALFFSVRPSELWCACLLVRFNLSIFSSSSPVVVRCWKSEEIVPVRRKFQAVFGKNWNLLGNFSNHHEYDLSLSLSQSLMQKLRPCLSAPLFICFSPFIYFLTFCVKPLKCLSTFHFEYSQLSHGQKKTIGWKSVLILCKFSMGGMPA